MASHCKLGLLITLVMLIINMFLTRTQEKTYIFLQFTKGKVSIFYFLCLSDCGILKNGVFCKKRFYEKERFRRDWKKNDLPAQGVPTEPQWEDIEKHHT